MGAVLGVLGPASPVLAAVELGAPASTAEVFVPASAFPCPIASPEKLITNGMTVVNAATMSEREGRRF